MSWPNFLAPSWSLMGLLAIPLVLLYILRQKRPDLPVSSTLLWSRTLADMRASTPFQKLRRNLLLLLQLLILAALVFTLMRPVIQASAEQAKAGVIVIDATASMQTTDYGEPSRLDRAKAEARKLVDTMRPGDKFKLIADGGGLNRVGYDFMTSKSELKRLIDAIKPSDSSSDLSESLILAAESLRAINSAKPGGTPDPANDNLKAGKVWLFSDGAGIRVPDVMGKSGELLQFVKIDHDRNGREFRDDQGKLRNLDHSVGVTQLSITPVPKEPRTYQVFVGLKNAWSTPRLVKVLLAYNQPDNYSLGPAKAVEIPPGATGSVVFEKVIADPGKLFVRVDDTDDDFILDNTAYGLIEPARKPRVFLVTAGDHILEQFMKTAVKVGLIEGLILTPANYSASNPGPKPDLVIFDGVLPASMPKVDTLLIRPPAAKAGDVAGFKITAEIEDPAVLRWKREDPLMQSIELSELQISKALFIERDPEVIELASAPESPLIAYKDMAGSGSGVRRYIIAFSPLLDSNWWRQNTFLIFLQHIVEQTQTRHYIGMPQLLTTGTAAKLWNVGDEATGSGAVTVTLPDASTAEIQAKDGAASFEHTEKVGFYEVSSGNKKLPFCVNLLSSTESDIRPRSLQTTSGGNAEVEERASVATFNKEIWHYLAIAALAVLLIEWWVYHRRIA